MKKSLFLMLIILSACLALSAQSRGVSFLKSLALPGLSQVTDGRDYGYAMMAGDAAIISGMFFFSSEEKLKSKEAYEFALKYAHIPPGSYSQSYFRDMSRFNNGGFEADGYNAKVRKDAISIYPHDPDMQQQYIDEHAYPEDLYWSWDSSDRRAAYSKIRISKQRMRDFGQLAMGALLLNHLFSGIDVLRYQSETRRSQVTVEVQGKTPILNLRVKF